MVWARLGRGHRRGLGCDHNHRHDHDSRWGDRCRRRNAVRSHPQRALQWTITSLLRPHGGCRPSSTESAVVTNEGTSSETIKLSPSVGVTSSDSGSAFEGYFKPCTDVGCWITGLPPTVTLAVGASQTLSFTVTVPRDTGPGQYLAGITAEPKVPPPPATVGSNGRASAKAIIIHQIDIGVSVTVGTLADLKTNLEIPTVTSSSVGSTLRLGIHVQNSGQTFVKATGTASCTVASKQLSFPVAVDTVLPSDGAVVPVNTPGLPFGTSVP